MKKLPLICLALITLLEACQKDTFNKTNTQHVTDTPSLTLTQARQWFITQQEPAANLVTNGSGDVHERLQPVISWDKAHMFSNKAGAYWLAGTDGKPKAGKFTGGYRKIAFFKAKNG